MGEPISFLDGGSRPFRTEMLVNRLVERGNSVLHWASTYDKLRKKFRFHENKEIALGSRLRYRFLHGQTSYGKNVSFAHSQHDRELAAAFKKLVSDEQTPDLILCSIPPLRLARRVAECAIARSIPFVIDVRDRWPDSFIDSMHFPFYQLFRFIFRSDRRRAKQVMHSADGITAISESCLRWALSKADRPRGECDLVFPLAYEEPQKNLFGDERQKKEFIAKLGLDGVKSVVTCLGRVGSILDFGAVLALAKRMAAEGRSDVKFVLAGEEPVRNLRRHAKLPNLLVTGWLDRTDLQRLLSISTVGLLPYRGDMHGPTVRNKAMDFLAMGVPVVSSLEGEFGRLMKRYNFGVQFQAGDVDDLGANLGRILSSSKLRGEMATGAATAFMECFTANRVYGEFAEFLEKFASSGGAPSFFRR
jgi:glycosyltransferase involved in cell wall biosynthesis